MTCLLFLSWLCSDLDVLTFLLSIVCVCVSSFLLHWLKGLLVDNCWMWAGLWWRTVQFELLHISVPSHLSHPSFYSLVHVVLELAAFQSWQFQTTNIWVYAGHWMFHIDVFLPSKQLVLFEPSLSNAHALHRCAYVFYGYTVFDSRSTVGASWAWTVVVLLWCPANCWSPTPPFHRAREYAVNHTAFILIRGCDVIA